MIKLTFDILGNQESPSNNPQPYFRRTQRSLWNSGSRRYEAWKSYVVHYLIDAIEPNESKEIRQFFHNVTQQMGQNSKAIKLAEGEKAFMYCIINWKNKGHADPDNVWKGIADALFFDDKHVDGGFFSRVSKDGKGKVSVHLLIGESTEVDNEAPTFLAESVE